VDVVTRRHVKVSWFAAVMVVLAATAALAAGCGGDDGTAGPATPASPAGTPTAGATAGGTTSAQTKPPSATDDPSTVLRASPWTSQPLRVEHTRAAVPTLIAVRGAHHEDPGYDRLVFEFAGAVPGYDVRYVPTVRSPGAGTVVALRGQAFLEVVFYPAAAHDDQGSPTLQTPSRGGGLPGLHEYRMAGDFEGYVHYGLGVDDVVGFRVTELARPSRIAIDLAA
jgi:hypothetical protein